MKSQVRTPLASTFIVIKGVHFLINNDVYCLLKAFIYCRKLLFYKLLSPNSPKLHDNNFQWPIPKHVHFWELLITEHIDTIKIQNLSKFGVNIFYRFHFMSKKEINTFFFVIADTCSNYLSQTTQCYVVLDLHNRHMHSLLLYSHFPHQWTMRSLS